MFLGASVYYFKCIFKALFCNFTGTERITHNFIVENRKVEGKSKDDRIVRFENTRATKLHCFCVCFKRSLLKFGEALLSRDMSLCSLTGIPIIVTNHLMKEGMFLYCLGSVRRTLGLKSRQDNTLYKRHYLLTILVKPLFNYSFVLGYCLHLT